MAHLVGHRNITLNARVTGIRNEVDGKVSISFSRHNGNAKTTFDKVIMAIPPSALKMIANRPSWSGDKELAIRSMHFETLYKMGLRFKTRFWERVGPVPCKGGQSTTDLPIRWIVYPSNGIGDDGPGVLLVYSWMTDADAWLPLTPEERRDLALANLAEVYNGQVDTEDGSIINVYDLILETSDAIWSARNSTGDAKFLPGQFLSRFEAARRPEGNIFFAGEHLSRHHTWIAGAVESAWETVCTIIGRPIEQLHSSVQVEPKRRPDATIVPETVRLSVPAVGHVGQTQLEFILQLYRRLYGLHPDVEDDDDDSSALVSLGVDFPRVPGPQGTKVRRI